VLISTANDQLRSRHEYKQKQQYNTGQTNNNNKNKKMNRFKLLTLKHELLKVFVCSQTAFAVEIPSWRAVASRTSEHAEVTNVPSRKLKAGCFEGRGTTFSAAKGTSFGTGWSSDQGVLPTVYRIKKLQKLPRPNKGM
jgi:hypothetical protein